MKRRYTAAFIAVMIAGSLFAGCGSTARDNVASKEKNINKEQVATKAIAYEETFEKVTQKTDSENNKQIHLTIRQMLDRQTAIRIMAPVMAQNQMTMVVHLMPERIQMIHLLAKALMSLMMKAFLQLQRLIRLHIVNLQTGC